MPPRPLENPLPSPPPLSSGPLVSPPGRDRPRPAAAMASDDEEVCDYYFYDDDDAEEDAAAGLEEDSSPPPPPEGADYWVSDPTRTPARRGDDNCMFAGLGFPRRRDLGGPRRSIREPPCVPRFVKSLSTPSPSSQERKKIRGRHRGTSVIPRPVRLKLCTAAALAQNGVGCLRILTGSTRGLWVVNCYSLIN